MSAKLAIVAGLSLLIGSSTALLAQRGSNQPPGQAMQDGGQPSGQPGASGYAPGGKMQEPGRRAARPGYAPHRTGYRNRHEFDRDELRRNRNNRARGYLERRYTGTTPR